MKLTYQEREDLMDLANEIINEDDEQIFDMHIELVETAAAGIIRRSEKKWDEEEIEDLKEKLLQNLVISFMNFDNSDKDKEDAAEEDLPAEIKDDKKKILN